jgi:hypothetical protein
MGLRHYDFSQVSGSTALEYRPDGRPEGAGGAAEIRGLAMDIDTLKCEDNRAHREAFTQAEFPAPAQAAFDALKDFSFSV